MRFSDWIRGARPQTLPLAISPVMIGASAAFGAGMPMNSYSALIAALCGCVALFLQIAANFANDYSDGIRGTDESRNGVPVMESTDSAGSGTPTAAAQAPSRLVASGVSPRSVLIAAGANALLACIAGLGVCALTGYWWFIALGIAALAAGWGYVGGEHPYGYRYLGEAAVFVFFGLMAVYGTTFALIGTVPEASVRGGICAGCVAVAVLCINNLRDIETDLQHGKHTWMTAFGRFWGSLFVALLLVFSTVLAIWHVVVMTMPIPDVPRASVVAIVAVCLLDVGTVTAVMRQHYRNALPLCTADSFALACVYVLCALGV